MTHLKDEEGRKHLLLLCLIPVVVVLLVLTIFVYLLASPMTLLNSYISDSDEYDLIASFKAENDTIVEGYLDLSFHGIYPMPFDGDVIVTDDFGYRIHPVTGEYKMHNGIDFGTVHHCEIKSIADGVVTFAGVYGTYGNTVIIKHETLSETFYSQYSHLSEIDVTEGQEILQGDVIGLEGGSEDDPNPGVSTGHHLHFAIMDENGIYLDPKNWLYQNDNDGSETSSLPSFPV